MGPGQLPCRQQGSWARPSRPEGGTGLAQLPWRQHGRTHSTFLLPRINHSSSVLGKGLTEPGLRPPLPAILPIHHSWLWQLLKGPFGWWGVPTGGQPLYPTWGRRTRVWGARWAHGGAASSSVLAAVVRIRIIGSMH